MSSVNINRIEFVKTDERIRKYLDFHANDGGMTANDGILDITGVGGDMLTLLILGLTIPDMEGGEGYGGVTERPVMRSPAKGTPRIAAIAAAVLRELDSFRARAGD